MSDLRSEVVDILAKMKFFQGQRAGRELWNDKPFEVQEQDLESFNKGIETIRKYILQLEEKAVPVRGEWIPVEERLPDNETEVEISCIRRYIGAGDVKKESYFTARAFYSDGTLTTEDSSFAWDEIDNWEYNEEKDAYVIPEGWWEYVTFSEQFGVVDAEVIAWMPLPAPYDMRKKVD